MIENINKVFKSINTCVENTSLNTLFKQEINSQIYISIYLDFPHPLWHPNPLHDG